MQLGGLVELEPINPRTVPFRLQSHTGRADALPTSLLGDGHLGLLPQPASGPRIVRVGVLARGGRGRDVAVLGWDEGWVDEEEEVRERGSEVGSVDGAVTRGFGGVEVFAATAVELDGFFVGDIGQSDGQEGLGGAEDPRAASEIGAFVFIELGG